MSADEAMEAQLRELDDVRRMACCPTCECFLAVVAKALDEPSAGPAPGGDERAGLS